MVENRSIERHEKSGHAGRSRLIIRVFAALVAFLIVAATLGIGTSGAIAAGQGARRSGVRVGGPRNHEAAGKGSQRGVEAKRAKSANSKNHRPPAKPEPPGPKPAPGVNRPAPGVTRTGTSSQGRSGGTGSTGGDNGIESQTQSGVQPSTVAPPGGDSQQVVPVAATPEVPSVPENTPTNAVLAAQGASVIAQNEVPALPKAALEPSRGQRTVLDFLFDLDVQSAIYGIVLFSMGLLILLESRREFVEKLTSALMLLAGFAFAAAVHEWLQMFRSTFGSGLAASSIFGLNVAAIVTIALASLLLAGYGLRLLTNRSTLMYLLPVSLLLIWVGSIFGMSTFSTSGMLNNAEVLAHYLIFVPASLIAALGTLSIARLHSPTTNSKYVISFVSLLFIANIFFAGSAVAGTGYPASVLNAYAIGANPILLGLARIPIALGITFGIVWILRRLEFVSMKRRETQQVLEHDSAVAAGIQQSMLPRHPLITPNIRIIAMQKSARTVSGDWYDYSADGGRAIFQIGDVTGKGIPAALLSSAALSTLSVELQQKAPLPTIFERVNRHLLHRFEESSFATLFLGRASEDGSSLSFINCGHEPPLLYRAGDNTWQLLETRHGLPLGVMEGTAPKTESLDLALGDRLIIYSDGLHDVRDRDGNFLSIKEIIKWLNRHVQVPSDELLEELVYFAETFCDGDIPDDMTVMIIERTSQPVAAA